MSRTVGEGRGRKSVALASSAARGEATGQQAIWEEMRRQRVFTRRSLWLQVAKRCGGNSHTIRSYIERLLKGGYIEIKREIALTGIARTHEYELIRDIGVECPRLNSDGTPSRQGRGRENMWRTIKILGDFSAQDLAVNATTEDVTVSEAAAKDYVKHLYKAGYLQITKGRESGGASRYRLIPRRWTGPRPPQVQRIKAVFDPNLGKVVWPKEVTDDRD